MSRASATPSRWRVTRPLLVTQGARVILGVQPPLKTLFANMGDGIEAIGSGEPIPPFDLHCPLMSLPLAFRTEVATIPADIPYLAAPRERLAQWPARLPPSRGLRVGLVWSGNATHRDDHNRSIALARLAPLFDVPGVQFVSLQKDLREADAQVLPPSRASPTSRAISATFATPPRRSRPWTW